MILWNSSVNCWKLISWELRLSILFDTILSSAFFQRSSSSVVSYCPMILQLSEEAIHGVVGVEGRASDGRGVGNAASHT